MAESPSPQPLECRIAVFGNQAGSGGFVTLPEGAFAVDPHSNVKVANIPANGYAANYGFSYDYAKSRWLPVPRAFVSPNGSRYVYPSPESVGGLYVVDVGTSAVHDIAPGEQWQIIEWQAAGIWAMQLDQPPPGGNGGFHGLYLINPDTGLAHGYTARGRWQAIGQNGAWGTDVETPPDYDNAHSIIRFDLTNGHVISYLTQAGAVVSVIGFDDQNRLMVNASNDVVQQIWALNSPNHADQVYSGPGTQSRDALNLSDGVADANGTWFGTNQGLMLYTTAGGFKKMASATGEVGGGCH